MSRRVLPPGICAVLVLLLAVRAPAQSKQQKLQVLPEHGATSPALKPLDDLMRRFVKKHQVPGAALAVVREGQVVYNRGFGWADRETRRPVTPDAQFRIASLSKPITALGILLLADQGRLHLDDPVLKYLPQYRSLPGKKMDPRWRRITIRHLLQHRGGWDRDRSLDCMFYPVEIAVATQGRLPPTVDQIIRFMMGWPLDFDPGQRYAYSNLGYCLLGRVIEHCTGEPYARWTQQHVLHPLDCRQLRLGRTLLCHRAPQEVRYYTRKDRVGFCVLAQGFGEMVPAPYGTFTMETLDSLGGWIATARDMAVFGSAVARAEQTGLLRPETARAITARPQGEPQRDEKGKPKQTYYGLGWMIREVAPGKYNLWHTGSLPGTSTLLVVRHDGFAWAVLFNMRNTAQGKRLSKTIDPLIHKAVDEIPWEKLARGR